jgi:hypothetical protein
MKLLTSLKTVAWRPVVGLLLAGLLGWLAAWFMLPSGGSPAGSVSSQGDNRGTHQPTKSAPLLGGSAAVGGGDASPQNPALEQLLKRQEQVSQGAASSTLPQGQTGSLSLPKSEVVKPAPPDAREAARAEKMRAMRELQTHALADIQAVPPGDTKKLMAAMVRFDAQMQAAGAPSIIDMDNLRKMLEATDKLQQLNRQLIAESEKARGADANKLKALSQEIQAVQLSMPKQYIKTDVLQKQLAK